MDICGESQASQSILSKSREEAQGRISRAWMYEALPVISASKGFLNG